MSVALSVIMRFVNMFINRLKLCYGARQISVLRQVNNYISKRMDTYVGLH